MSTVALLEYVEVVIASFAISRAEDVLCLALHNHLALLGVPLFLTRVVSPLPCRYPAAALGALCFFGTFNR